MPQSSETQPLLAHQQPSSSSSPDTFSKLKSKKTLLIAFLLAGAGAVGYWHLKTLDSAEWKEWFRNHLPWSGHDDPVDKGPFGVSTYFNFLLGCSNAAPLIMRLNMHFINTSMLSLTFCCDRFYF
jgi:hypothetical protein